VEKRNLLQVGLELYKCLMLTIVALLLLLVLSAYGAGTRGTQWTQWNPMPVKLLGAADVSVTNQVRVINSQGLFGGDLRPLKVEVENWPFKY